MALSPRRPLSSVLSAASIATGEQAWELSLVDLGLGGQRLSPSAQQSPEGFALVGAEDTETLVSVADGRVISNSVTSATLDSTTGTLAYTDALGIHGQDLAGNEMWAATVDPESRFVGSALVLLYIQEGHILRVYNAITGKIAQAYDPAGIGEIVYPISAGYSGSALLLDGNRYLLAAIPTE